MRKMNTPSFLPRSPLRSCEFNRSIGYRDALKPLLQTTKKSALLTDIDNTLMLSALFQHAVKKTGYMNDIHFCSVMEQLKNSAEFPQLRLALIRHYKETQPHLRFIITEDDVPVVITELHHKKIPVLAITARSSSIAEITLKRAEELGIQFTYIDDAPIRLNLPSQVGEEDAFFFKGVIFCSGRKKSDCFKAALEVPMIRKLFDDVEQVAFIDDSEKHCNDMYACLVSLNYTTFVTHYSHVVDNIPIASVDEMKEEAQLLAQKSGLRFP